MCVFVRSMWSVFAALIFTAAFAWFFSRLGAFDAVRYVILGGSAVSIALLLAVTRRLWRHETGRDDGCRRCGGPLGFYTFGKHMYGKQLSDYRRCWQCGKANSCEQG